MMLINEEIIEIHVYMNELSRNNNYEIGKKIYPNCMNENLHRDNVHRFEVFEGLL